MNYLTCKSWDIGGVLGLENNSRFVFSPGIQHPNNIVVSTDTVEREDFSEPGAVLMRVSCANPNGAFTLWTGKAQHQLGLKVPAQPCFLVSTKRGIQAPQADKMHLSHLPRPGICSSGCDGYLHPFRPAAGDWGEDPRKPEKVADHLHLGIWAAQESRRGISTSQSLLEIFWANFHGYWMTSLWCGGCGTRKPYAGFYHQSASSPWFSHRCGLTPGNSQAPGSHSLTLHQWVWGQNWKGTR